MEWILNSVYYVVPFIILLGILVFVHEFGHFIVARLSGVQVSAFSIGFGKELWGRMDKHGTYWKICTVPLGGYCQFLGDADASSSTEDEAAQALSDEEKKHAFPFQNPFKKLAIVLAGPGFNYLFAILVYTMLFATIGKFTIPPLVDEVMSGSAAEQAGIIKGDRILQINGHDIADFYDISREMAMVTEPEVSIKIVRDEQPLELTVNLESSEENQDKASKKYVLGVKSVGTFDALKEDVSLAQAFVAASKEVWTVTETTLRGVSQMITGKRGGEDIGGIIRIAEMSGDISKTHRLTDFLVFMALLSVNLGLINLFPIPVLDGGHVVFYTLEIITGREINERVKMHFFRAGLAILLALMVFATWNDITHLIDRWING